MHLLQISFLRQCDRDAQSIDAERAKQLFDFMHFAENSKLDKQEWISASPGILQGVTSKLHGPAFQWLLEASEFEGASALLECCQSGFPFVGELSTCEGSCEDFVFPPVALSVDELRSN